MVKTLMDETTELLIFSYENNFHTYSKHIFK